MPGTEHAGRYRPVGRYAPPWDRIRTRIEQRPSGCWEWTGAVGSTGYGQITWRNGRLYVHRVAYEALYGPIPEGLSIDHLCRNTLCVNPLHLEAVPQRENVRRGESPSTILARENRCRRGHDLTSAYITKAGRRQCRTCKNERRRSRRG